MDQTSQRVAMGAAGGAKKPVIFVAPNASPYVEAYTWSDATGFGTKYSNPSTTVSATIAKIAVHPDGKSIAMAESSGTFIQAYKWDANTGFGTKITSLSTQFALDLTFSRTGNALIAVSSSSPYLRAWQWSSDTGFGTAYSAPSTTPFNYPQRIAISNGNNRLILGTTTTVLNSYVWSDSTGFGAYGSVTSPMNGTASGLSFNTNDSYIAASWTQSGYINAHPLPTSTTFGGSVVPSTGLPTSSCSGISFSPTGTRILVTTFVTPYVLGYTFSSGFGSRISNPSTLPAGAGRSIAFSNGGGAVAVGHDSSPFVSVYAWNGSSFGAKYANPSTAVSESVRAIAFSPI